MARFLHEADQSKEFTFQDTFLVTNNTSEEIIYTQALLNDCIWENKKEYLDLINTNALIKKKYLGVKTNKEKKDLSRDILDVGRRINELQRDFVAKNPELFTMKVSRDAINFSPRDGFGNTPFVIANMNNVTGKRMAEAAAELGGSAALPQDMEDKLVLGIINYLNNRVPHYKRPLYLKLEKSNGNDPFHLHEDTKLGAYKENITKRDLPGVIVTDKDGKFVGIVHNRDTKTLDSQGNSIDLPSDTPIHEIMIPKKEVITVSKDVQPEEALKIMLNKEDKGGNKRINTANKVLEMLPVVNEEGQVIGIHTRKSAAFRMRYSPHLNASKTGLASLVTIGMNNKPLERAKKFIDAGASGLILDMAHADQGFGVMNLVSDIKNLIENSRINVTLIVGNVITADAVRRLIESGADIAKVGIGPGAMCSTRRETGVGRPQLSAVKECAEIAEMYGKHIWADGGIKAPRDAALAYAVGASQVMVGTWAASVLESPPDLKFDKNNNSWYKENHGMASSYAAQKRASNVSLFREVVGQRSEGISKSFVYHDPNMASLYNIVHRIIDGVTSSMSYAGASNMEEFMENAIIGIQGASGYAEGLPHGKITF